MWDSKKSKLMKEQEASRLLSSLGINTPLSKIPLSGILLFEGYKMIEIVNKILWALDKFMTEKHLRQSGFTYSDCGPFTKNKERIKNVRKQEIQDIFIKMN